MTSKSRSGKRQLYGTARWQRLRIKVIARDAATCRMCGCLTKTGRKDPKAAEVDHITPHRDNETLFWDMSNLQTLCKSCHGSIKQRQERGQRMQRAIGTGVAMQVRRVRPSARGGNSARNIRDRDLVDAICLHGKSFRQVLKAHGWTDSARNSRLIMYGLSAVLDRMR